MNLRKQKERNATSDPAVRSTVLFETAKTSDTPRHQPPTIYLTATRGTGPWRYRRYRTLNRLAHGAIQIALRLLVPLAFGKGVTLAKAEALGDGYAAYEGI